MNWTVLTFAVVFPLTFTLNEAFRRREVALADLAILRATLVSVMTAHRDWDWAHDADTLSGGRARLPLGHEAAVRTVLMNLSTAMADILLSPNVGHARHLLTSRGAAKRLQVQAFKASRHALIGDAWARLSAAGEELKAAGLPGSESSRLRQYLVTALQAWEGLLNVLRYRTPLTTRSYSRLFIWAEPLILGPYFAWIAGANAPKESQTNLGFAVALSVITAASLSGLYNIRYHIEDPFATGSLDTIRVRHDFLELQRQLRLRVRRAGHAGGETGILAVSTYDG